MPAADIVPGLRPQPSSHRTESGVNAVSPGLVERPGIEEEWPDGVARFRGRAPLARLGRPESTWITGQNIVVDGGVTAAPLY